MSRDLTVRLTDADLQRLSAAIDAHNADTPFDHMDPNRDCDLATVLLAAMTRGLDEGEKDARSWRRRAAQRARRTTT
jgi:hypothetical protein